VSKIIPRLVYIWEKHCAPRLVQIFEGNDLENKPEIPQSKFAKIHNKYLEEKARKKHHGKT
jgi:hypothetical protein